MSLFLRTTPWKYSRKNSHQSVLQFTLNGSRKKNCVYIYIYMCIHMHVHRYVYACIVCMCESVYYGWLNELMDMLWVVI